MQLNTNEPITEFHFQGTFQFPDDMDFLTRQSEHQCFVDLFNQMIENRLKEQQIAMNPDFKVASNYAKPIGSLCDNIFEQASKLDKP